jgi:CheY-like chemotaxis protein
MAYHYDVVIGSGSPGKEARLGAAKAGLSRFFVEDGSLGGTGMYRGSYAVRALRACSTHFSRIENAAKARASVGIVESDWAPGKWKRQPVLVGGLPTRISAEGQFMLIVVPVMVELSIRERLMKVYIVEDAPETREDIANALAPMRDMEVVGEAESVCDARKGIYASSPEAVILDISLPDGSGVEVLKLIRNWRTQIRVVVLTFDPSKELRAKCMELGAGAIFDKLNGFDKVVEFLQGLLPGSNVQSGETSFSFN